MNVFVETNFILELALEQQESAVCNTLLELARKQVIRLLIPAYSFIEPHEALTRRHLDRDALRARLAAELKQLRRSTHFAERAAAAEELVDLLSDSVNIERERVEQIKERVRPVVEVLPMNDAVLQGAKQYKTQFKLSPQDTIVYASVRARLAVDHGSASCFVSRNPRDFDDRELHQDLASVNCKYFSSFGIALRYIEHTIQ